MREVAGVRDIEVQWRLFSLATANADREDPLTDAHLVGPALHILGRARQNNDNAAVARFYECFGALVHERHGEGDLDTVRSAAHDAGLTDDEIDAALADPSLAEIVLADHREAVDQVGGFGVPTLILESGKGIFGPVVATAPTGEAAGELWDRVRWLIEADGFYELKRNRDRRPGG
jgi:protein-disulfide isomerase-like protein with CxxC motif